MQLAQEKSELSRRYMSAVANIQAARTLLSQAAPELLATLHRHHDTFRAMLQVNLTVLATAHACPKASSAASTPRCSAATSPIPIRPARGAGPAQHHATHRQPLALAAANFVKIVM